MRVIGILVAAMICLHATAPSARAQVVSTSPGKKNVYAAGNVAFSGSIADITATIAKGAKRRVLEIDAKGEVSGCDGDHVAVYPLVNGVSANHGDMYLEPDGVGVFRSNAGVWWLDLDAAEAQMPGTFINQPLNIILRANSGACSAGATWFAGTLRARLVKK